MVQDLLVLLGDCVEQVQVVGLPHRTQDLEDLGGELLGMHPLHEVRVGAPLGTAGLYEGTGVLLDLVLVLGISAHRAYPPR